MSTDVTRKYERAAYIESKANERAVEIKNVEELYETKKNSPQLYNKIFLGKLFCPECFEPQLVLCENQQGSYFLRGYPKQNHKENCSMEFDEVSNQSLLKTIENDPNDKLIQQRLRLAIQRLIRNQETEYHPFAVKECDGLVDLSLINKSDMHHSTQKVIPCKSLTAPFSDDDYNKLMIFYGNVKTQWEYEKGNSYLTFKIMRKGSNEIICSSLVSTNINKYISNTENCESANLAMFTSMTLNYDKKNNGPYMNFRLIHSSRIIIETE